MNIKILKSSQIDYDAGLYRFMNNVSLYEGLLKEFVKDNAYKYAISALERQDYQTMFKHFHSFRTMTEMLGMTELHTATSVFVELLRMESYSGIELYYRKMQNAYEIVLKGIKEAIEE